LSINPPLGPKSHGTPQAVEEPVIEKLAKLREVLSQSRKTNKQKDTIMKLNHRLLVFTAAVVLLAGCATNDHQNSGAMGNDSETGYGSGAQAPVTPVRPAPTGPNGSIGPGNPFGAGNGLQAE
jgi:hypothetical protein